MKTIGLIAGKGRFPLLVAQQAKGAGYEVASCAIADEADSEIERLSRKTLWVRLGELGKVIRFFQREQVREAVLAGKVSKMTLFGGQIRPDFEMVRAVARAKNWKDDSLLRAVADHLGKKGIQVLDSTTFLKECLLGPGVLTRRKPTRREREDIAFGWQVAKELGRLDIGQTVVVKEKAVLSVEAIEGTDEAIRRGGLLGREGAVVVKVAKPRQDMRFDVPAVGLATVKTMQEVKASVLALEAHKTLVLEREAVVDYANRHGISVLLQ